jgi:hypothetical protein
MPGTSAWRAPMRTSGARASGYTHNVCEGVRVAVAACDAACGRHGEGLVVRAREKALRETTAPRCLCRFPVRTALLFACRARNSLTTGVTGNCCRTSSQLAMRTGSLRAQTGKVRGPPLLIAVRIAFSAPPEGPGKKRPCTCGNL